MMTWLLLSLGLGPLGAIRGLSRLGSACKGGPATHIASDRGQMQGEKRARSLLFLSTVLRAIDFSPPSHTGQATEQDLSWHPRSCPRSPSCPGHQFSWQARADSCAMWAGGPLQAGPDHQLHNYVRSLVSFLLKQPSLLLGTE